MSDSEELYQRPFHKKQSINGNVMIKVRVNSMKGVSESGFTTVAEMRSMLVRVKKSF